MDYTDILVNIRKIIRAVNLESKRIEKEYGISIPQLLCMKFLWQSPGYRSNPSEIKNYLKLNASTVTGILQRLENKGYIAKLPKSDDRRVNPVTLTSKGAALVSNIPPLMHDRLSQRLSSLTDVQVSAIFEGLHQLVDIMGIQEIDASPLIAHGAGLGED